MFEFIGLVGSICFAVSSYPQVWYTIRTKDTQSVSLSFLIIFLIGAFSFSSYAILTKQYILLPNYLFCALGFTIILSYKIKNLIRGQK